MKVTIYYRKYEEFQSAIPGLKEVDSHIEKWIVDTNDPDGNDYYLRDDGWLELRPADPDDDEYWVPMSQVLGMHRTEND